MVTTKNFCQMVKYIIFYIQLLGIIIGANITNEVLHRVVSPFINLKFIIIAIGNKTIILCYGRGEKVILFNYLLPIIKRRLFIKSYNFLKSIPIIIFSSINY